MNIKMKTIIKLSEADLKELVVYYLRSRGYEVSSDNVTFSAGTTTAGYGMNEHQVTYFDGCVVTITEDKG